LTLDGDDSASYSGCLYPNDGRLVGPAYGLSIDSEEKNSKASDGDQTLALQSAAHHFSA